MASDASAAVHLSEAATELQRGLSRARLRVRLLLTLRLATLGGAMVAGVAAVAVLLLRLGDIWYPVLLPETTLFVVGAGALVAALLWPLSDQTIAASVDRRLRLGDRLGTAVQLAAVPQQSGMEHAMVSDALHHLRRVRRSDAYPLRVYRSTKVMGLCLGALLAVQMLPIPPLLVSPQDREDQALLRKQAAKIELVAKQLRQEAKKAGDAQAQKVARRLEKLAQQLRRGKLDKKQALLSFKEMEKQLEAVKKNVAPPALKTAGQAAEEFKKAGRERLASRAQQLAKQAAQQGKRELANKLENLAERTKQAEQARELKRLGNELKQHAATLGVDLQLPVDLAAMLAEALAGEDWEAALEKLGELGESLENPARELSEEELQKLAEQLDELAKILKDTDLEELAECLGEVVKCLKVGECELAAKCLAKGLKECESKICALKLAEACGEGRKCLGGCLLACRGAGMGIASAGRGVGPDRGTQKSIPPNAEAASLYAPRATDTSGTKQRVRGQVRPQGEMLATTEKGAPLNVSESRVPYYEVMGDYSKAVEEALAREDVPPAYRRTVREYFDALQAGTEP